VRVLISSGAFAAFQLGDQGSGKEEIRATDGAIPVKELDFRTGLRTWFRVEG
jgi:hypothetical protein